MCAAPDGGATPLPRRTRSPVEALRVYRSLLANRPLSKLLLGEFISGIGDWLYIVAIFVVIYRETNDPAAVGAFGAVRMIPYILLSVPAGLAADRFDRRLVLLSSDIVRGSVMVVMTILVATNGPVWLIVLFAMVAAGGSTFFYPAIGAYIPSLATDERQLGPANSAWASLGNVSFIVGPAIGGVLIATGGVVLAFVLNAATFIVIGTILWSLPPSIARARRPAEGEATAEGASGSASTDLANTATSSSAAPGAAGVAAPPRIPLRPISALALVQVLVVVLTTVFQRLVPDELRGRAIGLLMTLNTVSGATGAFVLPVVVVSLGAEVALGGAGLAVVVASVIGTFLLGSSMTRPVSPYEATLLRVAKLPLFAGVRASR